MHSMSLLPVLSELPREGSYRRQSHRELLTGLAESNPAMQAAEATAAASFVLWGVFTSVNVDDRVLEAYELAYPNLAADHSVLEHYLRVTEEGEASLRGFVSGLKGKLAELNAVETLEQNGYTSVEIAEYATQAVWDIRAIDASGQPAEFQVKTGASSYASDVAHAMEAHPDVHFMVSSEIYERVREPSVGNVDQLTDLGYDDASVETIVDGLAQLSDNMGLDITDRIVEVVPHLGAAVFVGRVSYCVIETEREFRHVTRRTKNRIHIARIASLLVSTLTFLVLAVAGAAVGTLFLPIVGSLLGTVVGIALGIYVTRRLRPAAQTAIENAARIGPEDLFYYRHKTHIDDLAKRFRVQLDRASEVGSLD